MESSAAYPRRPGRVVAWTLFILAIAAIGYAGRAAESDVPEDFAYRYSAAIGAVIQFALFFGVLLLIVIRLPKRQVFALRRPESWGRAAAYVVAGLGAIFALGVVLAPFLNAGEEQGLVPEEWDPDRIGAYIAFGLAATLVAPFVEELMFRGVGISLLAPYGKWVAILGTGVLFGLYHGLVIALPVLAGFGIVLGWLRWKTRSVFPCMALHAIFNGIAIASVPFVS